MVLTDKKSETPVTLDEFSTFPVALVYAKDKAVAVAVSGGPDSMALCLLLSKWAEKHGGVAIHAITVDHGLRPEATEEARQVSCWLSDIPFVTHKILTVKPENISSKSRIMEEARKARYGLLHDYCRKHNISKLYVAHHMNDQAETLLFRLAKGSGIDGLCAMRGEQFYDEGLTLMRPFLGVSKDRLIATCNAHGVSYVTDPSNKNTSFARVRLRQSAEILAKEGLSAKRLAVTAARLERGREALDIFAERIYRQALKSEDLQAVSFSYEALRTEPAEIRLRVLKRAMSHFKKTQNQNRGYGPRTERLEALEKRIFCEETFPGATLGGFLFSFDAKWGLLTIRPE